MARLGRRGIWSLAALLIAAAVSASAGALLGTSRDVDESIVSVALGGKVHARVILPPGYDDNPRLRYPVVYFLHGLPGTSTTYKGNSWLIGALEAAGRAILVLPQGARDDDTDPEYLDWGKGRNWATYVSNELPRYVDAHFRTIPDRAGRAIVGLSAGGYGAAQIGFNNLSRYSVIESWSGYFHPTDPSGRHALQRGPKANVHTLIPSLAADLKRRPTFLAFYVDSRDSRFRAENVEFSRELTAAHVPHDFDVYPGGHTTRLWRAHAVRWLRLALAHLASPRIWNS